MPILPTLWNNFTSSGGQILNNLGQGDLGGAAREVGNYFYKQGKALGIVGDSQDAAPGYDSYNGDWLSYLKDKAAAGDEASLDRLMNYLMSEQSAMNARNWTAEREDSQLQRFVRDAKAAGFNPMALLNQGASPISSSSSGSSFSGNPYISSERYTNQNKVAWAGLILNFVSSVFKSLTSLAASGINAASSAGSSAAKAAAAG